MKRKTSQSTIHILLFITLMVSSIESVEASDSCDSLKNIQFHACALAPLARNNQCRPGEAPFIEESCMKEDRIIPEFDNLLDSAFVESNGFGYLSGIKKEESLRIKLLPALINQFEVNQIAENIVWRLNRLREFGRKAHNLDESSFYPYVQSEIQIAFPSKYYDLIVKNGFLNQHQTQSSGGTLNSNSRREVEEFIANADFSEIIDHEKGKSLLPKYAYFTPIKDIKGLRGQTYYPTYGNVLGIVKESIKTRTTFTYDDSLFLGIYKKYYKIFTPRTQIQPEIDEDDSKPIEAQIWGTLTIKDLKGFIVNCQGFDPVDAQFISHLKQTSELPVYACSTIKTNGKLRFIQGLKL